MLPLGSSAGKPIVSYDDGKSWRLLPEGEKLPDINVAKMEIARVKVEGIAEKAIRRTRRELANMPGALTGGASTKSNLSGLPTNRDLRKVVI